MGERAKPIQHRPRRHSPTGTVTAHLNLEAKAWGAPRFQMRPRQLVAAEREYGQKDLSPYNRARGKSCSRQSKISANYWKLQSTLSTRLPYRSSTSRLGCRNR